MKKNFSVMMWTIVLGLISSQLYGQSRLDAQKKVEAQERACLLAKADLVTAVKGCTLKGAHLLRDLFNSKKVTAKMCEGFVQGAEIVSQGCDEDGFAWAVAEIAIKKVVENVDGLKAQLKKDGVLTDKWEFLIKEIEDEDEVVTGIGFNAVRGCKIDPSIKPDPAVHKHPLVLQARKAASEIKVPCLTENFVRALLRAELNGSSELVSRIKGSRLFTLVLDRNNIPRSAHGEIMDALVSGYHTKSIVAESDGIVKVEVELVEQIVTETIESIFVKINNKPASEFNWGVMGDEKRTYTALGLASATGGSSQKPRRQTGRVE
ncbi:MAG: hypothetical protein NC911_09645 [Candidatus Omnitrophica bacterium]|nr:hypothetical protein [Candidatus Omnitrophota bacterium]